MRSNRPYLLRALYEWITDSHCTPYILVNAEMEGVQVPREHIKDGKIILNIAASAVQHIDIGNQYIDFEASFSGRIQRVYAPIKAVLAIYARENGRGMAFDQEEDEGDAAETEATAPPPATRTAKPSKPKLTVIKPIS